MISVFGREVRGFILRGIQQKYHAVRSCWPAQRDSEGFPPTLITSTQPALLRYSQLSYSTAQLLFQNLNLLPHLWATLPHHHPQVTGKLDFFSCGHLCCLVATGWCHQHPDRHPDAVQISADVMEHRRLVISAPKSCFMCVGKISYRQCSWEPSTGI